MKNKKIILIVLIVLVLLISMTHIFFKKHDIEESENINYKPVIYLYPEKEQEIEVSLDFNGKILPHLYPKFTRNFTWKVKAKPDGTLIDENGKEYYTLFWEGARNEPYPMDKGFCVKGSETEIFLEEN